MKKIISLLLSVMIVFSSFAVAVSAAEDKAEITLGNSTYSYAVGSKITYTCTLDVEDMLQNGQFDFNYPQNILKITNVEFPVVKSSVMYNYSENLVNMMKFHFSTPTDFYDFKGGKALFTVDFDVIGTGKCGISLDKIVLSNSNNQNVLPKATFTEKIQGESYVEPKLNMTKKNLFVKNSVKLKVKGGYKDSTVEWKSSNPKVATVDKNGKVVAVKAGKANIIAKIDGKSLKCKLVVKNPTVKAEKTTIKVKGTTKIKTYNTVGKTTYKSLTAKIAKVNSKGVVTGLKKGKAKIKVVASGVKFTVKITVK